MTTEDEMTIEERFKYLRKVRKRYSQADRKERGGLLDEMEAITGPHRRSLPRRMNGSLERKPRRRERGRTYGPAVEDALRIIDESFDHICADRQTPNLVWMAEHLAAHRELEITPALVQKLEQISISTVKRMLKRIHQDQPRLPRRKRPKKPKLIRNIPMLRIPWDTQEPGHFEVDLVHHCGPQASGEYVYTLQVIDVATGWSERVGVLGRSYVVMKDAFRRILLRLPFPILEIHPDNGSEFLNSHMVRFWRDTIKGLHLSRSRPGNKDDNRFVEQKNSTLVRAYLGYGRLDTVAQTLAVNQLYDKMWLYYNLFQPVMRLAEKVAVARPGKPVHIKRRYDQAQTPFDRLCKTQAMLPEHQAQLETLRQQTNPRQLLQEINALLNTIEALPSATAGVTENVYHTLMGRVFKKHESLLRDGTLEHPWQFSYEFILAGPAKRLG